MLSVGVFVISLLIGSSAFGQNREELKLVSIMQSDLPFEASGLNISNGKFFTVSDDDDQHYIYEIIQNPKAKSFKLKTFLDLSKVKGFKEYRSTKKGTARFDLEGIVHCGDKTYLVNERVRQVLVMTGSKKIELLPIDFSKHQKELTGAKNAGFEGIGADCKKNKLYLAKERGPRGLFEIDLKTNKILRYFNIPGSDRQKQQVINPWNGQGLFEINKDYAGLYFENGFLYALERNTYEVTKFDLKTNKVVARVSHYLTTKNLYESLEPFGLAEGVVMDKKNIYLVLDNNNTPITRDGKKKHGIKGKTPVMLVFTRPDGF